MEEFRFNSLEELYKKLLPALRTKVNDLKRNNIKYIGEGDVWRYMRTNYWQSSQKLTLGEMVNDILSTPNKALEEFMVEVLKERIEKTKPKETNDNLL